MWLESSYTVCITNCVCGKSGLSWRTHSTPLMPGSLMSINTTSGFCRGSCTRLSSAHSNPLTNSKPSASASQPFKISRTGASSSTMETRIITFFSDGKGLVFDISLGFMLHERDDGWLSRVFRTTRRAAGRGKCSAPSCRCFFRRQNKSDLRATPAFALDFTATPDFLQPLAHVDQPVQARARLAAGQRRFRQHGGIKAAAIVGDVHRERRRFEREGNAHFGRMRMFEDVVQRFLEGEKQIVQIGRASCRER